MIRRLLCLLGWLFATMLLAQPAAASTFTLMTGNPSTGAQPMAIDSNQCTTKGPRSAYVGGTITTSGAETNIQAAISGLGNGFSLADTATTPQLATQVIGSLPASTTVGVYWLVNYGCVDGASTTVTITLTSSAGTVTKNVTLTARSSISANAGGQVTSWTLGNGAVVGQTIYFDAQYDFGGSSLNDEFIFQPNGSQSFDAGCFRLVKTQVISTNITGVPVNTPYQLYFLQTAAQPGNGYFAKIRYYFEYQCAGATTSARPYALQTSGNSLKYTGNYDGTGSVSISFPGATNPFTITKTADVSSAQCCSATTVTYTITVTNPSSYASRISQFVDTLPSGATYVGLGSGSNVTASNSSSIPSAGSTGTITFTGQQDQSYLIAAGGSVTLVYKATIQGVQGTYTNSAQAYFGSASTSAASATFTVTAPPPLTVVKASLVYSDPVSGTTNPKAIPGAYVHYTITVANPNAFTIDNDSVVISDPTPASVALFVNSLPSTTGPVLFQNGSPSSTLNFTYASLSSTTDDVDFSNDGGTSWTYTPVPDPSGFDSAITNIRIRPKGTMAANSSFTLTLRYKVN
jgi:fimbrial isopeptide formation D2 family protein